MKINKKFVMLVSIVFITINILSIKSFATENNYNLNIETNDTVINNNETTRNSIDNETTNTNPPIDNDEEEIVYNEYWEFEEGTSIKAVIEKEKQEAQKVAKERYGENGGVDIPTVNVYKINGTKYKDIKEAYKKEPMGEDELVSTNLIIESARNFYILEDGEKKPAPGVGEVTLVATVVKGDITGKGDVDVTDLSQMQEELIGTTNLKGPYREAADMNSDKEIDILDLSEIQEYIVNN